MAIHTFLDSNVLFAAHRGEPREREPSLAVLNDHERSFITSPFLYLETMPKAVYHRNTTEIEFYRTYFDNVRVWINDVESLVSIARDEAERCGLGAMDALHVAAAYLAAIQLNAEVVLLTLEGITKPIHRTTLVRVVTLSGTSSS